MIQWGPTNQQADGYEVSATWNNNPATIYAGSSGYHAAFRWANVTVPQGATILDEAGERTQIVFATEVADVGSPTGLDVFANDVDNAPVLSTTDRPTTWTRTTANVPYPSQAGQQQQTVNVQTLVQEIVDRASWASGNAMAFVIWEDGTNGTNYIGLDGSAASTLEINYTSGFEAAITDGIDLGDSVTAQWSGTEALTDGIELGDSVTAEGGSDRLLTDGIELGDSVTASYGTARTLTDGIDLGDSVTFEFNQPGQAYNRTVTDGILVGEDIDTTFTFDTGPEGLILGDTVSYDFTGFGGTFNRSLADTLVLGESFTLQATGTRSLTDGVRLGDSVTPSFQQSSGRTVTDGIVLGEVVLRSVSASRTLTDGILMGDANRVRPDSVSRAPARFTPIRMRGR